MSRRKRWITYPGAAPPPPTGRKYYPGHYTNFQYSQVHGAGGAYTGIPHPGVVNDVGPVCTGLMGLCRPVEWNELEPNGATDPILSRFDFSNIQADLDQCAAYSANSGLGVMYFMKLITKSFRGLGTNPLPVDLQQPSAGNNNSPDGYATFFTNKGGAGGLDGYTVWRWDATVLARLTVLIQHLSTLASHPNFHGVVFQESAIGITPNAAVDGYSLTKFKNALVQEHAICAAADANWRSVAFVNQIHSGGKADLKDVCAQIQQYGAIVAGPDLVTDLSSSGLVNGTYPILKDYHFGTNTSGGSVTMPGTGPTGSSVQPAEWAPKPPADPAPVVPGDLFNWATSSFKCKPGNGYTGARDHTPGSASPSPLNVDYFFWDYDQSGTPTFNGGATPIIASFPQFGSWSPP